MRDNKIFDTRAWENRYHMHVGGPTYGKAKVGEQDFVCRVEYVLYDDEDIEKYQKFNGRIGAIECRPVIDAISVSQNIIPAYPIESSINRFPVVNELVLVRVAPNEEVQSPDGNYHGSFYYTTIVSTWGSKEHNATPDERSLDDNNISVTGDRFNSTGLIRPLLHNPGDITFEGRTGNTIRLGSSNTTSKKSPFKGNNNRPLIVIRNGQDPSLEKQLNSAVYEDVNNDGGVIYFLSGQYNPLILGNYNFESYNQNVDVVKSNIVQAQPVTNTNPTDSVSQKDVLPTADKKTEKKEVKLSSDETKSTIPISDELKDMPDEEGYVVETDPEIIELQESESEVYEDNANPPVVSTSILNILAVPHVIQNTSWKCFLASTEMIFKYFGSYTVTQNSIPAEAKYLDKSYNFYSQDFYKSKGYNLKTVRIKGGTEGYAHILNIFNSQKPKIPLILERRPTDKTKWNKPEYNNKRHFVTIVGVTKDNTIIVNDPGRKDGKNVPLKIEELLTEGGTVRIPLKY